MTNSLKTNKYSLFAAALVLLVGLSTAAIAQDKPGILIRLPPEPFPPVVYVNAIEISAGPSGLGGGGGAETQKASTFDYRFLGQTTGSLPGSLTLFMTGAPAIQISGDISEVTGGAWTLPVYLTALRTSRYAGSLYGTVVAGKMQWDKAARSADISLVLNVNGGTEGWEGVQGYATFVGTLTIDEESGKTTLTGQMEFTTQGL